MAKLQGGTTFDTLTVYGSIMSPFGNGYSNCIWWAGTASASVNGTWFFPPELMLPDAKFKITVIGSGGAGLNSIATAGSRYGSGGSGGVLVALITVTGPSSFFTATTSQLYNSLTYFAAAGSTVGAAGSTSSVGYAGISFNGNGGQAPSTYTGGAGGTTTISGTAAGFTYTNMSLTGNKGCDGGICMTNKGWVNAGGNTPLGYGWGGRAGGVFTGHAGAPGYGYGSGGQSGVGGSTAAVQTGGVGAPGLIMIEW
jgi:hypothetical protein